MFRNFEELLPNQTAAINKFSYCVFTELLLSASPDALHMLLETVILK